MKISRSALVRAIKSILFTLALVLAASYPSLRANDDAQIPSVGTAAPDFTLDSQEGTPVSLHDYRGKWVVLYFYPKDASPGCTVEAHGFQNDLGKYDQKKAVVLGVSVDSVDSHKAFCAKDSLTFKLLSDATRDTVSKYGSLGSGFAMRNTFLIDPSGKIAKEFIQVNPGMHSAEVLAALDDLQKSGSNGGAATAPAMDKRASNSGETKEDAAKFIAQASRGKDAYQQSCSACHQADLGGIDMAPSLAGSDFINRWAGKTGRDFFDRTSKTMPADRPGGLSAQAYLDLLAYVLQVNDLPQPGEVTTQSLDGISFH